MSKKHLLFASFVASCLLAGPVYADGAASNSGKSATTPSADASTSRRDSNAAPVIHRRSTLSTGWFGDGQSSSKTTAPAADSRRPAQPVVHYDTAGQSPTSGEGEGQSVRQRLQQVRSAVVYDDLPTTTPQIRIATPETGSSTTSASGEQSSRRVRNSIVSEAIDEELTRQSREASESADSETSPMTINELPASVSELPSVMKRTETLRHSLTHESTATVSEPSAPVAVESMSVTPITERPLETVSPVVEAVEEPVEEPVFEQPSIDETPAAVATSTPTEGVLIAHESALLSVTTRGPRTIVVGKTYTYQVDLMNRGEAGARDVVVNITIPHWVEVVQQHGTVGAARIQPDDHGDSAMTWTVGTLDAGKSETLSLDLIPRGSRPLDFGITWTSSPVTSTAQIEVQEPKLDLSVVGPQDVLYGETKLYTITVSNPGTGDAENVVLNLLPLVPSERSAGVRQLGVIKAGTRQTMEVELTARQTGRLQVRAEVTGDGGLHSQGVQDVLVRRAALDVEVQGPAGKYAGTQARYAVRITNSGDAIAQDVVAVATLPAGAKNVATSDGGSLDSSQSQVQWNLGSLRPGANRIVELECVLMSAGANRLDLRTVAAGDLSALASAVTEVESLADLKMTVNDPKGAVAVGADVTYEVRIVNRGTKAAENIGIYGFFSEGIEPTQVVGWRGTVNEGEVALDSIPRIGAGQEMVIKITAQAQREGDHVFRAELECRDPQTKLAVEEWTRFFGDTDDVAQKPINTPVARAQTDATSGGSLRR